MVKRYEISSDLIARIDNPVEWSQDGSSRVNFNASNLSSEIGEWGDESVQRHIEDTMQENAKAKKNKSKKTK